MKILKAMLAASLLMAGLLGAVMVNQTTDSHIRDRVVKLHSAKGSCSGIQIKTPRGHVAILTAAHCQAVLEDGMVRAQMEDGRDVPTMVLAIDEEKDLMLMSPVTDKSIQIAKSVEPHEAVHTLTHGAGHATYRTDGELLEEGDVMVMVDDEKCDKPGQQSIPILFMTVCVKMMHSMRSTAMVVPGSSGGPVLDRFGHLVGIVSNTDGTFAGFVTLKDIHEFLKNR